MIEVTFSIEKLEYFLFILVRIASFLAVAPFFSMSGVPQRVRLGLALFLSIILYNVLPVQQIDYVGVIGFAIVIIKESIAGILIGFSAYMCSLIVNLSGRLIDMEIGLAMAQEFDPTTKTQSSITGTMYTYLVMLIMLASDMHIFLINALVESFSLIPINGEKIGSTLYDSFIGFITEYFIIGFRIALPVFAAALLMNCVLGIMAKVAPQMHMFAVGIQLKLLTGLLIMFVTVRLLPAVATFVSDTMKRFVEEVMRGLM